VVHEHQHAHGGQADVQREDEPDGDDHAAWIGSGGPGL
jgi:hypothetical protein